MASVDSVRVCCRFRPQNQLEIDMESPISVEIFENKAALTSNENERSYEFDFDSVFPMEVTQQEVFNNASAPLVDEVLRGYNGTIFVYGQTGRLLRNGHIKICSFPYVNLGSGKTFTMTGGANENRGIIPRSVEHLFSKVGENVENMEYTVSIATFGS